MSIRALKSEEFFIRDEPYYEPVSDELTASDLVGRYLVTGGETVWVDGPLEA